MGGARPSRSCSAATPPSLLKTLPLKWGRVFQLKKRSIFFFSKKADEVGKGRRNRHRLCSSNRSSNCLSEKRRKGGREGKEQKRGQRSSVYRGERCGDQRFGGTSYKRNCHWECCGSEGSIAIHLGSRAQLAGGRCPVGGKGWGHRPGDRKRLAKWHRALQLLGSCREGLWDWLRPGTVVTPHTQLGLRSPRTVLISGDPQKTGKGRKRRRRQFNERLQ